MDSSNILPTNIDAERSVLGAILLDSTALAKVLQIKFSVDDFYLDQHRRIFRAMLRMEKAQKPIDSLTVVDELERDGDLAAIGNAAFIGDLVDGVPRVSHVEHYAKLIQEKARLRRLMYLGDALQQGASEGSDTADIVRRIQVESSTNGHHTEELLVADMPDEVLDGRLGEICNGRMHRFPISYAWPALVTVAGAMVPQSKCPLRSNLYTGLIGPVHSGKTQAEEYARRLIGIESPRLQSVMSGSAEGLLSKLKDAEGDGRLVCPDELGHLFSKASIENASFPFILNRAFYQSAFDLTTARKTQVRFNASLSLLGGLVDSDFQKYFDSGTVGGLHDRFIFGVCPQPFEFEYRPFDGGPETFMSIPLAPVIDSEVWECKRQWLKDYPIGPRIAEIALRVAAICAAFDGRAVLRVADLKPALAFARRQAQVRVVFQPNPGENPDARCGFAVQSYMERYSGSWLNTRELYRAIHGDRYGSGMFHRVLQSLSLQGEIELTARNREIRRLT